MMFPAPRFDSTFASWCIAVDLRLLDLTGRPLADAPLWDVAPGRTSDEVLRSWWSWRGWRRWDGRWEYGGIPAEVVAAALSDRMAKVQATFVEHFTDKRIERIQEQWIGKVAV